MTRTFAPTTYITVHGDPVRTTDKAVLFKITKIRDTPVSRIISKWLPYSQMAKSLMVQEPGQSWCMISEWIYNQNNLDDLLDSPNTDTDREYGEDDE